MRPNFVRPAARSDARRLPRLRHLALPLILAAGLTGCGSLFGDDEPDTSAPLGSVVGPERNARGLTGVGRASEAAEFESISGGFVVADEPRAALAARRVLERGGTAADAATALYFTLAVTQPASAGLGGGGVCLVHDPVGRTTESIEFLPRRATAGGPVAIPGNVRGFALLHARYGRKTWRSLISPAERMAATGSPVSRAMAQSLAPHTEVLRADPEMARGLLGRSGAPLKELDVSAQIELASTLGLVRSRGVSALYGGDGVVAFAEAIAAAGGAVSVDDLRNYRPIVNKAQMVPSDGLEVYLPSASTGAGAFAAALWQELQQVAPADAAAAAAAADATAQRLRAPAGLPDDMGSTGFVAVTARGDAVACAVTMNGPLGAARIARSMGLILAATPEEPVRGVAPAFLAPAIVTGPGNGTLVFAGASAGGPKAVAGVMQVMRQSVGDARKPVSEAIAAATPGSGVLVNAVACPAGLPLGFEQCEFGIDPDGVGLGLEAVGQ